MNKHDIIHRMLNPGIIAVIRADSSAQLLDAAKAMAAGGVIAMEVTMTTPSAIDVIRAVSEELGDRVLMGVGTVLDDVTARLAILAGAEYVVTPVMRPDVIALCRRYSKPVVCGAYTPTEALAAHEAGADFIKLFPADTLGPAYIKGAQGPPAATADHPNRRRDDKDLRRLYPRRLRRRRRGREPDRQGRAEEQGLEDADRDVAPVRRSRRRGAGHVADACLVRIS